MWSRRRFRFHGPAVLRLRANGIQNVKPRGTGQLHIQQNHVGTDFGQTGQALLTTGSFFDHEPLPLEDHPHRAPDVLFIVHNQD